MSISNHCVFKGFVYMAAMHTQILFLNVRIFTRSRLNALYYVPQASRWRHHFVKKTPFICAQM